MKPLDVLTAFYQNGKNNCATIAIIKLAIAHFGKDRIFKSTKHSVELNEYNIVLQNDKNVVLKDIELKRLSGKSGFTMNSAADAYVANEVIQTAYFCFSVIVKYIMEVEEKSEDESVHEINGTGINSDYAYLNLGFTDEMIRFLTPDNVGTLNANDFAINQTYLLYNNNHCVMSVLETYDEYSYPENVSRFTKKHSSFFKPGKRCWGYTFIN